MNTVLQTLGQLKLKRAIEQAKLMDPDVLDSAVEQEIAKERRNLDAELHRRVSKLASNIQSVIR